MGTLIDIFWSGVDLLDNKNAFSSSLIIFNFCFTLIHHKCARALYTSSIHIAFLFRIIHIILIFRNQIWPKYEILIKGHNICFKKIIYEKLLL